MNSFLSILVDRFEKLETELNSLDAATGDGDHGITMVKGLRATIDAENPVRAFRTASGGASGSLFSLLIGALGEVINDGVALDDALKRAADRIGQMGQAKVGDKTMLDALIPASNAGTDAGEVAKAARDGWLATKEMAANRGRAKYVEDAGVGHLDAGARSVVEILDAFAQWQKDRR